MKKLKIFFYLLIFMRKCITIVRDLSITADLSALKIIVLNERI